METKNVIKKNPFEMEVNSEEIIEIKKSDIWEAMQESSAEKLTIKKTAAQLKEQVSILLLDFQKKEEELNKKLAELIQKCGLPPSSEPSFYPRIKLNLPWKEYSWCECQYKDPTPSVFSEFAAPSDHVVKSDLSEIELGDDEKENMNYATSLEEAKNRKEYNSTLRELREILIDKKTCEVLQMCKDGQVFNLTVNQVLALGFK